MTLSLLFWVLMLLLLVGGIYANRGKWAEGGVSLVLWLALLCLGWATFGAPVR